MHATTISIKSSPASQMPTERNFHATSEVPEPQLISPEGEWLDEKTREAAMNHKEKTGNFPAFVADVLVSGEGVFDVLAYKCTALRPSEVWSYLTSSVATPFKWWDFTTINANGVEHHTSNIRVIAASTIPPTPPIGGAFTMVHSGNYTYTISYALKKTSIPCAGFVAVGVDPESDRGNFAVITYNDPTADVFVAWGKNALTITPRLHRCLTADPEAWDNFRMRYGTLPVVRDRLSYYASDDSDSARDDDAGGSVYAAFLLTACSRLTPDPHVIVTGACLDSYVTDFVEKKRAFVHSSPVVIKDVVAAHRDLLVCDFKQTTSGMAPRTLLHILERNYKHAGVNMPVLPYRIRYSLKRRPVGNYILEQMQKSNEETKEQVAITFDPDAEASRVVGSGTLLTQKSGNFFYPMNSGVYPTITSLFVDVRFTHVGAGSVTDIAKGKMSTAMCIYARKDGRYYPYTDVANNILNGVMMTQNYPPEVTNIVMAHGTFNLGTVATQLLAVQSGYATTLYNNGFQFSTTALLSMASPRHSLKDTADFCITPIGHYKPTNRMMMANSTNFPWPAAGGTVSTVWSDAAIDVGYPPTVARFSGVVSTFPTNFIVINGSPGWSLTNATYGGVFRFNITGSYMYPLGSGVAGSDNIAISFALKSTTMNLDASGAIVSMLREEVQTIQTKLQGPNLSIGFTASLTLPVSSVVDSLVVQAWIAGAAANISTGYFIHATAWELILETPDVTPRLVPGLVSLQPTQTVANINMNALLSVPATLSESLKITPQMTSYPVQLARGALEQGLFSYMSGIGLVNMSKVLKTDLSQNAVMPIDMLPYPQVETEAKPVPDAPMRTAILPLLGSLASTFLPVIGNKLAEMVGGPKPDAETKDNKRLDSLEKMLTLLLERTERKPYDTATKPRQLPEAARNADVASGAKKPKNTQRKPSTPQQK